MSTYNRLLVSKGGGLLDVNRNKSDRHNGVSICIGLGGTGKDTVKQLKEEIFRRLKPDDPFSPLPIYGNIKFLAVDQDDSDLDTYYDISNLNRSAEYFDISDHKDNKASRTRQASRSLLIHKADLLKEKLTAIIQEATLEVYDGLNIYIFSGLSGKTGGGIFLDMCYIVRHALETLGKGEALISGYFFLADVNLSMPSVEEDPLHSRQIKRNCYGALKELDYYMDLKRVGDRFTQDYGSFSINTNQPPVDLCCLLSAASSDGALMKDGYNHAISVAVEHVISMLSKIFLPDGLGGLYCRNMRYYLLRLHMGSPSPSKKDGAFWGYTFMGAASVQIPYLDLLNYLGAKLFERFRNLPRRAPTENDLTKFVAANKISYEELLGQLTEGITYAIPYPEFLKMEMDVIPEDKQVLNCADTWMAGGLGLLEENRKIMTEELKDYQISKNSSSIISRIFSSLYSNYVMDSSAGPFFAMKLLGGPDNKNLIHVIDDYIQINKERETGELRLEQQLQAELGAAEESLTKASFLTRKKRTRQYLKAVNNWFVHRLNLGGYRQTDRLLRDVRAQAIWLYQKFFLTMATVLDTLNNTFAENLAVLSEENLPQDLLKRKIITVGDIRNRFDEEVEKTDIGQAMKKLMDILFHQWGEWISQDENKITLLISEYITREALPLSTKEITDYLRVKYQTTDAMTLSKRIHEEIIEKDLKQRSKPLLWKNPLFNLSHVVTGGYIQVPFNSPEIREAAEMSGGDVDTVIPSNITDTISMMEFYCRVPLYAYQGLAELEKIYEEDLACGGR